MEEIIEGAGTTTMFLLYGLKFELTVFSLFPISSLSRALQFHHNQVLQETQPFPKTNDQ
jgi:hypothetical protein